MLIITQITQFLIDFENLQNLIFTETDSLRSKDKKASPYSGEAFPIYLKSNFTENLIRYSIEIALDGFSFALSCLGMKTFKTPFSCVALIWSVSAYSGKEKDRVKLE